MERDNSKFKIEFKKRLYKFTLELIEYIDKLPNDRVSRRLADQLIISGTSIIGNYIEGQSASSKKDFINYFNTSLKSSNESKLWISLLKDSNRADELLSDKFLKRTFRDFKNFCFKHSYNEKQKIIIIFNLWF